MIRSLRDISFRSVALALLSATVATSAEPPAVRPQFEVASVREDPPSALRHAIQSPIGNRFHTTTASVRLLIQYAYDVQPFEISDGPDWMNTIGYDVDARAVGNPTGSEIRLMLQSLLEDRFRLKMHRGTKEVPVYRLVVAKSGNQLPKPKEGDCTNLGSVSSGKDQQQITSPCGEAVLMGSPSGMEIRGRQIEMASFSKLLCGILGRPVLDKIGITEKFDINVEFACDELTPGIPCPRASERSGQADEPAARLSIMGALQRQLGLKLEPGKGPTEVIVIDSLERPTPN
jgi:uncharacterized protein (TIGR03435 family)